MAVLMKPEIVICEPKKNKHFGYKLFLNYKGTGRNLIEAKSKSGRIRGIKGEVFVSSKIECTKQLKEHLSEPILKKINFALDMAYGETRLGALETSKGMIKVKEKILYVETENKVL
jgi:hypothetical protein